MDNIDELEFNGIFICEYYIYRKNNTMSGKNNLPSYNYNDKHYINYYKNGMDYRINGPARICDDYIAYFINRRLHRRNGAAYISNDEVEYYIKSIKKA